MFFVKFCRTFKILCRTFKVLWRIVSDAHPDMRSKLVFVPTHFIGELCAQQSFLVQFNFRRSIFSSYSIMSGIIRKLVERRISNLKKF